MRLVVCLVLLAACGDSARENPTVEPAVSPLCGPTMRLVHDVCTELGGDDSCSDVGDVCVPLCDAKTSCTTVDADLRVTNPWPVAPDGYCVVCLD